MGASESKPEHSSLDEVANLKIWDFLEGLSSHSSGPLACYDRLLASTVEDQTSKASCKTGNMLTSTSGYNAFAHSEFSADDSLPEYSSLCRTSGSQDWGCTLPDPIELETTAHGRGLRSGGFDYGPTAQRFGQETYGCQLDQNPHSKAVRFSNHSYIIKDAWVTDSCTASPTGSSSS